MTKTEQQRLRRWAGREWRLAEGRVRAPGLEKCARHIQAAAREFRRGRQRSGERLMEMAIRAMKGPDDDRS